MSHPQSLFEGEFETRRPPNAIFCHQEFLEKLEANRTQPIGKRASLLLQRLAVDSRRQHYKSTHGVNQGWRRSRLGGNGGSHFYAWWAPKSAAPLRTADGFQNAPDGALFLRDIRHHDDHSFADPQSFDGNYLPVTVPEIRREDFGPAPWTAPQLRFTSARQPVRILKGHPGSGKTTALLHAADASNAERVLYLTYSRDLAGLAQQYFDRYCSSSRQFQVFTYENFIRRLLGVDTPVALYSDLRRRFRGDLTPFTRSLNQWTDRSNALYDELHAHLIGAALPIAAGRYAAVPQPRTTDKDYRTRRIRAIGEGPAAAALDIANRLQRSNLSLAERYFPELDLAWKAASLLAGPNSPAVPPEFLDLGCIAVDECQDLTPLEALVIIELARLNGRNRRNGIATFFAGDEAQTVRPTDFEWGWMNDLLHTRLGTPTEFKLAANLRSPRSIALVVNQVWNLYAEIEKRDRPSGTGVADIDDDSTDEVLYCTAAPGEELNKLMAALAAREGVAMVAYDEAVMLSLPEEVRGSILTASEVKGLDFHTVCLLNAGQHLGRIIQQREDYRFHALNIESIRRRLAIDELRVGISRPADRLIWLDVSPNAHIVHETTMFLARSLEKPIWPCVPSALKTALDEEQLDLEERIQRCQHDARQFLSVRPDIAWSRAQQAITLLGDPNNPTSITDAAVRSAALDTLAEICFCLGVRKSPLAPELGNRNLFQDAANAATRPGLRAIIHEIGSVIRADSQTRLTALGRLATVAAQYRGDIEPWILTEIAPKTAAWLEEMEAAVVEGDNAAVLAHIMPPFYEMLRVDDAPARSARLIDRCVRHLVKHKRHQQALEILQKLAERRPELEAECLEAVGSHAEAAALYRSIGKLKEALACYRAIPDFEAAVSLIREIPDHAAGPAYNWLIDLKAVLERRPQNFAKVMTAPEKAVLEQLLEQGLGVTRRKPAAKKAAPKKVATKKATPTKPAAKKPAPRRLPRFPDYF
jgi:tetratricopeptide (TPR) repeat protein